MSLELPPSTELSTAGSVFTLNKVKRPFFTFFYLLYKHVDYCGINYWCYIVILYRYMQKLRLQVSGNVH